MIQPKRTPQPWADEHEVTEDLPVFDDMDDLAGSWSTEQAREFLEATADFDQVDDSLWG
jgi:hypothetical protein